MNKLSLIIAFMALLLASCVKDRGDIFQGPGHGQNPPVEDSVDTVDTIPPGNQPPTDPIGDSAARDLKIKLRAVMKIGDVVYDSIPASLTIRSWDSAGQMYTSFYGMTPGTNELDLRDGQARFQFLFKKWNSHAELNVDAKDISSERVYVLGVNREAKKLKTELVYRLMDNQYVPESKLEFAYLSNGNIDKITQSLRNDKGSPYVAMTSQFMYSGQYVERINRYDANNNLAGFTSFTYNGAGKVREMREAENGNETVASVEYSSGAREEVIARYTYSSGAYDLGYYMQIENGNLAQGSKVTSGDQSVLVNYRYDMNINPYLHLNWPDLWLSHQSKNNVVVSVTSSSNTNPGPVPSSYSYTYDNDGYPKEVVITYKHGLYGNYLYTTKTVFTYR